MLARRHAERGGRCAAVVPFVVDSELRVERSRAIVVAGSRQAELRDGVVVGVGVASGVTAMAALNWARGQRGWGGLRWWRLGDGEGEGPVWVFL